MVDSNSDKEQVAGMFDGFKALADKLAQPTDGFGVGQTERLPHPIKDSFGTFNERKKYFIGCDIGEVLLGQGGVVIIEITDGDTKKVVEIGKTPGEYDPGKGGKLISEAGEVNKYLMAIKSRKGDQSPVQSFRYVDESEIKGAGVRRTKEAALQPRANGARQIRMQGIVDNITSLR